MGFAARAGARGQATVELAIIAPVLLLVLMATAQFGTILVTQIGITNVVGEAAREASAVETTTEAAAGVNAAWANTRLVSALLPGAPGYDGARLETSGPGSTQVCFGPATDLRGAAAVVVQVRASYRHGLWLPVLSVLLDQIDGVSDGALRITADQEMSVANVSAPTLASAVCAP